MLLRPLRKPPNAHKMYKAFQQSKPSLGCEKIQESMDHSGSCIFVHHLSLKFILFFVFGTSFRHVFEIMLEPAYLGYRYLKKNNPQLQVQ